MGFQCDCGIGSKTLLSELNISAEGLHRGAQSSQIQNRHGFHLTRITMWGRKTATASQQRRSAGKQQAGFNAPDRSAEIKNLDTKIGQLDRDLIAYKRQMQQAKSLAAKKKLKSRAMEVLQKKRQYEKRRDQTVSQQMTMENVAFQIESARSTAHTVKAMRGARQEMQRNMVSVHEVDDLQDDMQEFMDEMNMCNDALGQGFNNNDYLDEDDLAAEFAMMDDEPYHHHTSSSYHHQTSLPQAPTATPARRQPASVSGRSSASSRGRVAAYGA